MEAGRSFLEESRVAESLQFSIGADTKNFTDGIGGALTALAGLAGAFLSVQAVVTAFSEAINLGGRLNDLSTRTGETAGNLLILERSFDNASVGAEKLGPAIAKMQKSMVDMQQDSKEAVGAFEQLGLTWADLEGKSPAQQLELIGIRLATIEDPALRAETAMRIFGKSGAELLPVLINFSAETEQAKAQLGSLPELLDRSAGSVDSLGDNLSAIRNKLTELAYGFLSEVAPALDAFTGKLAGIDAASIGVSLANALLGAFDAPMTAASLLGESLLLGAKMMGNELVFQINYWSDIIFKTFSTISSDLVPILGNNMTGAFAMAAGTLGNAIAGLLAPMADFFGLDFIQELSEGSQNLIVQGAAKITDSTNAFASAMEAAKNASTVVRQDIFGAEESSARIQASWASVKQSGEDLADRLNVPVGTLAPQSGAEVTDADRAAVVAKLEALEKVEQKPVITTGGGGGGGKTDAQIKAEQQKQLGLIAGADFGTAIGPSASAQKALDLQKELDTLNALGKGGTPEAAYLQTSIQRNLDIAFGNTITSADRDAISQLARDAYFQDTSQSITDLERQFEIDLLEQKRANDPLAAQEQRKKAEEAGAGGAGAKQQPQSVMGLMQQLISLVQKIEPKIPQHIMI